MMDWKRLAKYAFFAIIFLFGSIFGLISWLQGLASGFAVPSIQVSPSVLASIVGLLGLLYLIVNDIKSRTPKKPNSQPPIRQEWGAPVKPRYIPTGKEVAEETELHRLYPTFYMNVMELILPFDSKTQEMQAWDLLRRAIWAEAVTSAQDARTRNQIQNELWKLIKPIMKSRRKYKLNPLEKLSDLLGFFP
jgi:hypothetical protein